MTLLAPRSQRSRIGALLLTVAVCVCAVLASRELRTSLYSRTRRSADWALGSKAALERNVPEPSLLVVPSEYPVNLWSTQDGHLPFFVERLEFPVVFARVTWQARDTPRSWRVYQTAFNWTTRARVPTGTVREMTQRRERLLALAQPVVAATFGSSRAPPPGWRRPEPAVPEEGRGVFADESERVYVLSDTCHLFFETRSETSRRYMLRARNAKPRLRVLPITFPAEAFHHGASQLLVLRAEDGAFAVIDLESFILLALHPEPPVREPGQPALTRSGD